MDSKLILLKSNDWFVTETFISNKFPNIKIIKSKSVSENKNLYFAKSFLDNSKKLYIINDIKDLNDNIDIIDDIISGKYQNNNFILYVFNDIDKRSKLFKKYSSLIIEPNLIPSDLVLSQLGEQLDEDLINRLFDKCNKSISSFYFELNKIKSLSEARNIVVEEAFNLVLNELVDSSEINTFDLINSIANKDFKNLYNYIIKYDNSTFDFGLFTLLYNQFHNMFVIKDAGSKVSTQTTGLNQFVIKNLFNSCSKYSTKSLNNILRILYKIDKNIKLGITGSEYAFDLMLVRLLNCAN